MSNTNPVENLLVLLILAPWNRHIPGANNLCMWKLGIMHKLHTKKTVTVLKCAHLVILIYFQMSEYSGEDGNDIRL